LRPGTVAQVPWITLLPGAAPGPPPATQTLAPPPSVPTQSNPAGQDPTPAHSRVQNVPAVASAHRPLRQSSGALHASPRPPTIGRHARAPPSTPAHSNPVGQGSVSEQSWVQKLSSASTSTAHVPEAHCSLFVHASPSM